MGSGLTLLTFEYEHTEIRTLGQTSDTRTTYTTSYEYNGGSQLTKMIYPSGQQVSVNHDDKGRMQSLTYNPGDTSGYLTGVTYNIEARMTGGTLSDRGKRGWLDFVDICAPDFDLRVGNWTSIDGRKTAGRTSAMLGGTLV